MRLSGTRTPDDLFDINDVSEMGDFGGDIRYLFGERGSFSPNRQNDDVTDDENTNYNQQNPFREIL